MADDAATVEQLRVELRHLRELYATACAATERQQSALARARVEQAATTDVLRAIAASSTDLDRVLDAVSTSAMQLCDARDIIIFRSEDHGYRIVWSAGPMAQARPDRPDLFLPIDRRTIPGRAMVDRAPVHVPDVLAVTDTEFPLGAPLARQHDVKSALAVPLIREGTPVGALYIRRGEVRPFTDQQIALLASFADQAVIAIENARLFQELEQRNRDVSEALEQQTATAEVLRVIASSPTDVQRVLDTITESAARLCEAPSALLLQFRERDGRLAPRAWYGRSRDFAQRNDTDFDSAHGVEPTRTSAAGRAYLDGRTIQVADMAEAVWLEYPGSRAIQAINGMRTVVYVPLLRHGVRLGVLSMQRSEVKPFTNKQIALLETFADQAVIAIENARLFEELEQRNAELQESNRQVTEALEQQTAISEILRVIASSPTDLPRVLTAITTNAGRLCDAAGSGIWLVGGDEMWIATREGIYDSAANHAALPAWRHVPISREFVTGRAALEGCIVHSHDIANDPEFPVGREMAERVGQRTTLGVPLLRDRAPIGVLSLARSDARPFSNAEIDLVTTFADQAVIAIENARLFSELQEANERLAEASGHKSQFLANMSHELRTPLNAVIGYSEMLQEEAEDLGETAFLPDLQKINAAGKHLLGLINDILDLSKIEAGKMDLHLETFEVGRLVSDVEAIVQPLMDKNANRLVVACPDDIGTMHADQTKVRQALFNLLSNAAKFTDHGTITLTVGREPDDWLSFAISDTGIGMTEE